MICNWENPGVVPIVEWNTAKPTAARRFNHTRVCLHLSLSLPSSWLHLLLLPSVFIQKT